MPHVHLGWALLQSRSVVVASLPAFAVRAAELISVAFYGGRGGHSDGRISRNAVPGDIQCFTRCEPDRSRHCKVRGLGPRKPMQENTKQEPDHIGDIYIYIYIYVYIYML
jgi:hypothetical protein